MGKKGDFEFLNSELWLKYTQERYLSLDEIKYRLQQKNGQKPLSDWEETKTRTQNLRKLGAVPLFMESLQRRFWFYPADCIQKHLDEIDKLGTELYQRIINQDHLLEDFLNHSTIEEAVTSAIYEGANTTRAKAKTLIETNTPPKSKDEWMVVNNFRALSWIKEHRQDPVTIDLINELHRIVTKNTLQGDDINFSGRPRNDRVSVGPHEGIPHEIIESALNEAIQHTSSNPRYLHGLIKGTLLHYFIAYIHPYFDGNGRTARALFYFKSIKNDLKFVELLSISAHLKENRKKYEKSFELVVENDFDITYFIQFCLESLSAALVKVNEKVQYLIRIGGLKEPLGLNVQQILLLQKMALQKYRGIGSEDFAAQLQKSREMARLELKSLEEKGLLREEKSGKKLLYFINSEALKEQVDIHCR